jgi:hypothetical protein
MNEIYDSSIRPCGDIAGVFEFDGVVSYFYICNVNSSGDPTIRNSVLVDVDRRQISTSQIKIVWASDYTIVGLKILSEYYEAFECETGAILFNDLSKSERKRLISAIFLNT